MNENGGMNITEFLEARIAEDEADALPFRNELGDTKQWRSDEIGGAVRQVGTPALGLPDLLAKFETHLEADHVARWDPARALAECAAKRAIVAEHHPDRQLENWYWSQRKCAECGGTWHKWLNNDVPTNIGPEQGCRTLRHLAAIYASHPDYRQEWSV